MAYLGLSKICKFIQGPKNSVYVFPEFFRLNILALKLGLFLHHFWILLETDQRGQCQGRRDNLNGRLPVILKTQDKHAGQAGAGLNANRPTITNKMSRLNWHPLSPRQSNYPRQPHSIRRHCYNRQPHHSKPRIRRVNHHNLCDTFSSGVTPT
eukprot:XP_019918254.1 PREDICTED: uncharacterized protein LOC105349192 isoform X3 [Crassostrea gigas]